MNGQSWAENTIPWLVKSKGFSLCTYFVGPTINWRTGHYKSFPASKLSVKREMLFLCVDDSDCLQQWLNNGVLWVGEPGPGTIVGNKQHQSTKHHHNCSNCANPQLSHYHPKEEWKSNFSQNRIFLEFSPEFSAARARSTFIWFEISNWILNHLYLCIYTIPPPSHPTFYLFSDWFTPSVNHHHHYLIVVCGALCWIALIAETSDSVRVIIRS